MWNWLRYWSKHNLIQSNKYRNPTFSILRSQCENQIRFLPIGFHFLTERFLLVFPSLFRYVVVKVNDSVILKSLFSIYSVTFSSHSTSPLLVIFLLAASVYVCLISKKFYYRISWSDCLFFFFSWYLLSEEIGLHYTPIERKYIED